MKRVMQLLETLLAGSLYVVVLIVVVFLVCVTGVICWHAFITLCGLLKGT